MRFALGVVLGSICCFTLWLVLSSHDSGGSVAPASGADEARTADLERRLAHLEAQVGQLSAVPLERAQVATPQPATFVAELTEMVRAADGFDVRWYLQQYVQSFDASADGSEYFRLAVDAYAAQLLIDICTLVRDGATAPILRIRLAAMLGTPRFARQAMPIDALLALLRSPASEPVHTAALEALRVIGDAQTGISLERLAWSLPSPELQKRALAVLVQLDGADANRALQRLFAAATSAYARSLVIAALSAADAEAALEVFQHASTAEDPVRLQAAKSIQRFRGDTFRTFIDRWLGYETDAQIRQALGEASKRMSEIRPYSPQKAAGPPDADANRDDANAWATQSADMGTQWIELSYKPSRRASVLRIHEVCVAGEIVQVLLVDDAGKRHEVWAGVDPTVTPGVFEVRFPPTSYRVRAVRIVLDTDKRAGWCEIDAVELLGPDGSSWAQDAVASSSYGA